MEYCCAVPNSDELTHYGVKGMHWGVRRYQNPDGTLTSAGKAHVSEWKKKETQRRSDSYSRIDYALKSKRAKLLEKKNKKLSKGKDVTKINKKLANIDRNKQINEKMKSAEIEKIKKMNINDIQDAKLKKAGFVTKQALKGVGTAALVASGGGYITAYGALNPTLYSFVETGKFIAGGGKITADTANALGIAATQTGLMAAGVTAGTKRGVKSIYKSRYSNLSNAEKNKIYESVRPSTKDSVDRKPEHTGITKRSKAEDSVNKIQAKYYPNKKWTDESATNALKKDNVKLTDLEFKAAKRSINGRWTDGMYHPSYEHLYNYEKKRRGLK